MKVHHALALAILGLALAGCGPGGAGVALFVVALWAFSLAGCADSHERGPGDSATPTPDSGPIVSGEDAGGFWETCCDDSTHRVSSCFCPAGWACNYGWFEFCDDGTCSSFGGCPDAGVDGGTDAGSDAGGDWEPCCDATGHLSTCFCPSGVECNYGAFTTCGGDTCVYGPTCPTDGVDAG